MATVVCEPRETKVVTHTMELSDAAKVVRQLEPVIDNRWARPVCFLAAHYGSTGQVVVVVDCEVIKGQRLTESKGKAKAGINRVVDHQTLNSPQRLPAETQPVRRTEDIVGDAGVSNARQEGSR
jgi:hypothetical protein